MTFVLGMTGFSGSGFTGTGGFDLLAEAAAADDRWLGPTLASLRQHYHRSVREVAEEMQIDEAAAARVLVRLCRQGRCMFDVQTRRYRHRELFEQPADEAKFFPPDLRRELAARLLTEGKIAVESCQAEENVKTRKLKTPEGRIARDIVYRDWRVMGRVADAGGVEIVINDSDRVIFGRCQCPFFEEHLLNQGPCEHMLALFEASRPLRADRPTSTPTQPDAGPRPRLQPSRWEVDNGGPRAQHNDETDEEV